MIKPISVNRIKTDYVEYLKDNHSSIASVSVNNNENINEKSLFELLQDYTFASKYYNDRLNHNRPIIEDKKLLTKLLSNDKSKQNILLFFAERAKYEASLLKQKKSLSILEKDRLEGYNEIINSLPNLNNYVQQSAISFKGTKKNELTSAQRRNCHIAIHTGSAICGGISVAMGEGAAVGADTPFLMGTQYAMFAALQKILNLSTLDHINYILRQYLIGQALGVNGAKIILSWLGIAGHAISAGTASAPITATVRSVNASLSAALTEKMGWGYVSAYEKDNMKFTKQALQTGIYLLGAGLFGNGVNTVLDTVNPDHIQTAMESIPKETLSTFGNIIKILSDNVHVDRFAFMFTADVAQKVLFAKENTTKEQIVSSIKTALLNTVIYDLLDYSYGEALTYDAQETVKKIAEDFKNDPSIWKEFESSQRKLFSELNLDDLSLHEFQKRFKDKSFVYNMSMLSREVIQDINNKWKNRNFNKLRDERAKIEEEQKKINKRSAEINRKLSSDDIATIAKTLEEVISRTRKNLQDAKNGKFGLVKIAGYDNTKQELTKLFLVPVLLEQSGGIVDIPGAILFYGPSGTGKTAIGSSIAEEGSKFITKKRSINIANCKQLLSWLEEKGIESEKRFNETRRRTIIQLNEFGEFEDASKQDIENFVEFIKTCSKKYHMTLFFTTNNPLTINEKILALTKNIPMGPAKEKDVQNILQFYLGNAQTADLDYNALAKEIVRVNPQEYYSNAQLEQMAKQLIAHNQVTQMDFIKKIQNTPPLIDARTLNKFTQEKEILNPDSIIAGN